MKLSSDYFFSNLDASQFKAIIVGARFNQELADALVEGAKQQFLSVKGLESNLNIIRVPGTYELPLGLELAIDKYRPDLLVALGVIIQGETPHFDMLCLDSTQKVSEISLKYSVPIGFGVVMARNLEQAKSRADYSDTNKGKEAMSAAIEMAMLKEKLVNF